MINETKLIDAILPPQPHVVVGNNVDPNLVVDPIDIAHTMNELGISLETIADTTVYIDGKNHLLLNGSEWPQKASAIRFPELDSPPGNVVQLSTKVRGNYRSPGAINKTLVHELEHTAQSSRKDRNILLGNIAILGLAAAGAFIGSKLGNRKTPKVLGGVAGAFVGSQLGNKIAPHERQARSRANTVITSAISRRRIL